MTYNEMFKDWDYLFKTVGCASDMTGGYVESDDLDRLMRSPNKATAKKCMSVQISYWFDAGIEYTNDHKRKSVYDLLEEFPRIEEIAERHFKDLEACPCPFVIPT
jgi:F420-0:gamma-glutamyl ligase-like protein